MNDATGSAELVHRGASNLLMRAESVGPSALSPAKRRHDPFTSLAYKLPA
jgi:hypothetical protein